MADLRKGIVQYALRQDSDFDKYRALELIEGLKNAAILCKDKKADFYTTVHIKLLGRMDKPAEHKGYILALIGDREYEKIMESVAKIDKSLVQATPVSSNTLQLQDNNASYSFPPPYGYPSLSPYQGVIPQPPPILISPPTIISPHLITFPRILVQVTIGVIVPALLPFLGETVVAEAVTGVYIVIFVEDHIE